MTHTSPSSPLKVVVAPNAFKESLTAQEACVAMRSGILSVAPNAHIQTCPLADGGDGILETLLNAVGGEIHREWVQDSLGNSVHTSYGITESGVGLVEMALASGLALIPPEKRTPQAALQASSYGTGQIVHHLLEKGCKHIILGIGGSATTDGGTGFARALGFRFLDKNGQELPNGGASLVHLSSIQKPNLRELGFLESCRFQVACDVDNPLLGKLGSAEVFSPQKGADTEGVYRLEQGLTKLADIAARDLGIDYKEFPGVGAAGGIGFWLKAFHKAELLPGAELMIQMSNLSNHLADADLLLTAEGALDSQSAHGKLPAVVAKLGKEYKVPTIAFAGNLGSGWELLKEKGLTAGFAISPGPISLEQSISQGAMLLEQKTQEVVATFLAGQSSHNLPSEL